jgi:hypothetical protein
LNTTNADDVAEEFFAVKERVEFGKINADQPNSNEKF